VEHAICHEHSIGVLQDFFGGFQTVFGSKSFLTIFLSLALGFEVIRTISLD
jgi:hypothetical protein